VTARPPADVDVASMATVMRWATLVALVLAVVGAVAPGPVGTAAGVACLVVLIGTPVVRVLWLTIGWERIGDRRFAAFGGVLLLVLALSGVLGFL